MTNLTIKTQAAIQHLNECLTDSTDDNLEELLKELERLVRVAKNIKSISAEINH